jgi:hypothetical protein
MAVLSTLRRKLGIKPPYFRDRRNIEKAIQKGRLALHCGLERYSQEVQKVLGWDSLDAAELGMVIEEYGRPVRTVGDLMRMFEALDADYEARDR